ncbi:MAG: NAD-dependent epimerase/dehydratase family protein [Ferruginibacter sp.]
MILVTGGAGLLGRELIKQLLSKGKQVRAIFNKTPLPDFHSNHLQQFQCNILDIIGLEELMQGVDEVYHCAAIISFELSRKREMFKINVEGTTNVVNAALSTGVKKLVHVSSVSALGRPGQNEPINESMNWTEETGNSYYGNSKYLGELEVWRGIGEGLDAVIINPSIIFGEADWNTGSSQIFKTIYDEFPWYTEGITGFVDVRDVAKAMIALMESNISGERFIISAENRSYRDVFNLIANAFGKKQPYKKVTPFIAAIVWRLEAIKSLLTGNKPLITRETAGTALANTHYENSKLPEFLPGFRYRALEETITDTCSRMQQKLNNH